MEVLAPVRSAPSILAPARLAPDNSVPRKLAPGKLAKDMHIRVALAPSKLAPVQVMLLDAGVGQVGAHQPAAEAIDYVGADARHGHRVGAHRADIVGRQRGRGVQQDQERQDASHSGTAHFFRNRNANPAPGVHPLCTREIPNKR